MRNNTPFRNDFVGSFLRPQKLKEARKAFDEGNLMELVILQQKQDFPFMVKLPW